jgi:hypothetical protein
MASLLVRCTVLFFLEATVAAGHAGDGVALRGAVGEGEVGSDVTTAAGGNTKDRGNLSGGSGGFLARSDISDEGDRVNDVADARSRPTHTLAHGFLHRPRFAMAPQGTTCQGAGLLDITTREECFGAAKNFLTQVVPERLQITRHMPWAGGCKMMAPEASSVQYLEFNTNFANQDVALEHHSYICIMP